MLCLKTIETEVNITFAQKGHIFLLLRKLEGGTGEGFCFNPVRNLIGFRLVCSFSYFQVAFVFQFLGHEILSVYITTSSFQWTFGPIFALQPCSQIPRCLCQTASRSPVGRSAGRTSSVSGVPKILFHYISSQGPLIMPVKVSLVSL